MAKAQFRSLHPRTAMDRCLLVANRLGECIFLSSLFVITNEITYNMLMLIMQFQIKLLFSLFHSKMDNVCNLHTAELYRMNLNKHATNIIHFKTRTLRWMCFRFSIIMPSIAAKL